MLLGKYSIYHEDPIWVRTLHDGIAKELGIARDVYTYTSWYIDSDGDVRGDVHVVRDDMNDTVATVVLGGVETLTADEWKRVQRFVGVVTEGIAPELQRVVLPVEGEQVTWKVTRLHPAPPGALHLL